MCTLLVGIAPGVTAAAQDYEVFSFNSTIEPSVETFNIAQYGKLEPSLYTGTMSYSLPIYVRTLILQFPYLLIIASMVISPLCTVAL